MHLTGRNFQIRKKSSVLVEFAAIAIIMYLLLAGILTFGRLLFVAQTTTGAIDSAARELSRTPLPASATFEDVRDSIAPESTFRTDVYSEDYLAINIDPWLAAPGGMTLLEYLDGLDIPRINRMLVPVMQLQFVNGSSILRYPGTLIESATAPSGLTVVVPVVLSQMNDGTTSIRFVRVIEEVDTELEPGDNTGPSADPFMATSPEAGLVALRINYPFQSASMIGSENGTFVIADDSLVSATNSPGGAIVTPADVSGPNAGQYGLGIQLSFAEEIRPFRRVLSTQANYPREIFE